MSKIESTSKVSVKLVCKISLGRRGACRHRALNLRQGPSPLTVWKELNHRRNSKAYLKAFLNLQILQYQQNRLMYYFSASTSLGCYFWKRSWIYFDMISVTSQITSCIILTSCLTYRTIVSLNTEDFPLWKLKTGTRLTPNRIFISLFSKTEQI